LEEIYARIFFSLRFKFFMISIADLNTACIKLRFYDF